MTKEVRTEKANKEQVVYEITEQELLEEMYLAIKDYFVVACNKERDGLTMDFPNGQSFLLTIKEIARNN